MGYNKNNINKIITVVPTDWLSRLGIANRDFH